MQPGDGLGDDIIAPTLQARCPAMLRKWARSAILLAMLAGLELRGQNPLRDAGQQSLEYRVKAAFLLNFTKFVEWPPAELPDSNLFGICILGDDPFGSALDRMIEGETVNGRKLAVLRTLPNSPKACQVVFVSKSEKDYPQVLAGFKRGVLTVGEEDAFLHGGGMIAFVVDNRRVRFDVDLSRASKGGLKISSKLLNVARSVEE